MDSVENQVNKLVKDVDEEHKKKIGLIPMNKYIFVLIIAVSFLSIFASTYFAYEMNKRDQIRRENEIAANQRFESGLQYLQSAVSWDVIKQKKVMFMRDIILKSSDPVSKHLAYEIAKNNFELCSEIYRSVDPLFLLAMQWVESRFKVGIVTGIVPSPKGARGLNQTMPRTAKFKVNEMRKTWTDQYLKDPTKNTEITVFFLDQLFAEGLTQEEVLAVYNCCYDGAEKFRSDSLPKETKEYIPAILDKYKEYQIGLENYVLSVEEILSSSDKKIKK